jgi:hypothetical protein
MLKLLPEAGVVGTPYGLVILDEAIRRIVGDDCPKVVIKASCDRAIGDRFGEVHVAQGILCATDRRFAIVCRIVLTEMPLANTCSCIAVLLQ